MHKQSFLDSSRCPSTSTHNAINAQFVQIFYPAIYIVRFLRPNNQVYSYNLLFQKQIDHKPVFQKQNWEPWVSKYENFIPALNQWFFFFENRSEPMIHARLQLNCSWAELELVSSTRGVESKLNYSHPHRELQNFSSCNGCLIPPKLTNLQVTII